MSEAHHIKFIPPLTSEENKDQEGYGICSKSHSVAEQQSEQQSVVEHLQTRDGSVVSWIVPPKKYVYQET